MIKKSKIIGFRTTRELHTQIAEEAMKNNLPVSWLLRGIVTEYLKQNDTGSRK